MGWKGQVRSIQAAYRASERDAKRRQRELEKQQKQYEKMVALERAEHEVNLYQNHLDLIQSVHKDCSDTIDWEFELSVAEPQKPEHFKNNEENARNALNNYKPSFLDRTLKREAKKQQKLEAAIQDAISQDKEDYKQATCEWETEHNEWLENQNLAKSLFNNDAKAKIKVIAEADPFSEISALGSRLSIKAFDNGMINANLSVCGADVIPTDIKTLLKSGRVSEKKMPKGQYNELYQDYVCSCVLRVANELFALLPDEQVFVTATDNLLNTKTGHLEEMPILSVCVSRSTINGMNMQYIDPSDSMDNFVHNMSFKKTKGFDPVEELTPDFLQAA